MTFRSHPVAVPRPPRSVRARGAAAADTRSCFFQEVFCLETPLSAARAGDAAPRPRVSAPRGAEPGGRRRGGGGSTVLPQPPGPFGRRRCDPAALPRPPLSGRCPLCRSLGPRGPVGCACAPVVAAGTNRGNRLGTGRRGSTRRKSAIRSRRSSFPVTTTATIIVAVAIILSIIIIIYCYLTAPHMPAPKGCVCSCLWSPCAREALTSPVHLQGGQSAGAGITLGW